MGWRDLVLDRITDDDSGGGFTPDFFKRSGARKKYLPNTNDPIGSLRLPPAQEEPIDSVTQPWRPTTNRRTMSAYSLPEQGPAMTDYLQHISNIPKREDYAPSIWHKLAGSLSGGVAGGQQGPLAGIKTAAEVTEIPWRRAREEYELKGEGLEAAAKIEETTNRTRQQYQKELLEQDQADKDREVKWANSEINRLKAEQAAKRIALESEAKRATNQVAVDRLQEEIRKNDRGYETELAKLELVKQGLGIRQQQANTDQYQAQTGRINAGTGQRRVGAYERYLGGLADKPVPQTQISAARTQAESEARNSHMVDTPTSPAWFDAQGYIKPEFAQEFEREVQERIARKIRGYGNIRIEPMSDDNPYEEIK